MFVLFCSRLDYIDAYRSVVGGLPQAEFCPIGEEVGSSRSFKSEAGTNGMERFPVHYLSRESLKCGRSSFTAEVLGDGFCSSVPFLKTSRWPNRRS